MVHLVVVAIELVIYNDELVRIGIIVIIRHVKDILALHVGGVNCDVVAIVVVVARDSGSSTAAQTRRRLPFLFGSKGRSN